MYNSSISCFAAVPTEGGAGTGTPLKRKTGTYSGHAFTTVQQDATVWLATTIPTSSSTAGDAEQQEQQGKHDVSEDPVPPAFWSVVSEVRNITYNYIEVERVTIVQKRRQINDEKAATKM